VKHFYITIIVVGHLYGSSRDDFAYILCTFPIIKEKEKKAFGKFIPKPKYLKEGDTIGGILSAEEEHS